MENPILVNVWRGEQIESAHRGSICVCDPAGKIVFEAGAIDMPVFPRSAIKALQALPLIESGAADKFALSDAEIALACASHNGEARHADVAAGMLAKAGLTPEALECGAHWPMGDKASRKLAGEGGKPTALHNNCSGKHAGFLCVCCAGAIEPRGYIGAKHRLQAEIRDCMTSVTGAGHSLEAFGIDGCSIPTYAVPLRALALGFARLGSGAGFGPERAKAAKRILKAIATAPEMVAGEDRFDTKIMQLLGDAAMVKVGAEGVYCGTIPALGLGIAIKCDDGNVRAAEVMMAATLRRLMKSGLVQGNAFEPFIRPILKNWNGIEVARLTPAELFAKAG